MNNLFDVKDKVVVITGGLGVLCAHIARELAQRGAIVGILHYSMDRCQELVNEINDAGHVAFGLEASVLDKGQLEKALESAVEKMGQVDVLINGAGGNRKEATASPPTTFFDLDEEAIRAVFDLNGLGTMLPCQVFGEYFAERKTGVILNMSSMAGITPLTNVVTYSAAKAAISNFTQWLSTYMAQRHSPEIRVNAVAPGFFLTKQNRFLLTDEKTGELTDRGNTIISHTPMDRFGDPEDLVGTVIWLISDASRFVTGTVIPVDGGFSAFSGV